MNCKNCGGIVHFEGENGVCQSCGSTLSLDSVYENIDVCICYEESDANGRRTKDSLVAQEVYKKLEQHKLSTFYEHISADGLIGDDLESSRKAAISRAKIIIVLGSTTENFAAIEEKYGQLLSTKTVVPFCVDINPGSISKTLSKIQAICYSTIGWDKDLVNGICNFLGREVITEKRAIRWKLPEKKYIVIGAVSFAVLLAIALSAFLIPKLFSKPNTGTSDVTTEATTEPTTEHTTVPASPQEICEMAAKLIDDGDLVEALILLEQIPDYPNADSKIISIYKKYEGCYQVGSTSVQLRFFENKTAKVDVNTQDNEKHITFSADVDVSAATISGNYIDNHKNSGNFIITLENTGFQFVINTTAGEKTLDLTFTDENRVDQPNIEINHDTLMKWLDEKYSFEQIATLGYTLESVHAFDVYYGEELYRIQHTEIYIAIGGQYVETDDERIYMSDVVCGIYAPANLIAPSLIGEKYEPYINGNYIYQPGKYFKKNGSSSNWYFSYFDSNFDPSKAPESIAADTMIGIAKKNNTQDYWEAVIKEVHQEKIENLAREKSQVEDSVYIECIQITSNDTHYLYCARLFGTYEGSVGLWYKVNKNDHSITFDREGTYEATFYNGTYKVTKTLWFTEYIDYAKEFPSLYNIEPGTSSWDGVIEDIACDKVCDAILERYPQDDGSVSCDALSENDTHILILAYSKTLKDAKKCAWYKCSKADGTLTFIRDDIYVAVDYYNRKPLEHLWFMEYSDLAKEFPDVYDTDTKDLPYLQDVPYTITVTNSWHAIYTAPSDDYVKRDDRGHTIYLEDGTYTIVEEKYDEEYNLWGKLESGEDWVCLSSLF